jgi:hypothetical protein
MFPKKEAHIKGKPKVQFKNRESLQLITMMKEQNKTLVREILRSHTNS